MNAEYHELPENFTVASWQDLANDLLCAGQDAENIRDALVGVYPNYEWFVLVQASTGGWSGHVGYNSNYGTHQASNLCGKNLVIWMYSGSYQISTQMLLEMPKI